MALVAAVGVAYVQCGGGGCADTSASCASCTGSAEQVKSCGSCAKASECKDADACAKVDGTVRYVRSTNKAVKVMNGENGYLLRVGGDTGGCQKTLVATISNLDKGDAVSATYKACPTSGKLYLCTLKTDADTGEGTTEDAPAAEDTPAAEGTSS